MKKYKKWSKEELCYISENCNKMKDRELATLLSEKNGYEITVDMLRRQRRKLKIRKKRGRPYKSQDSDGSEE
tara:strand:+ start:247 stop:462 length:216 start_codon:yes stop_codon:yes gene_type:complete